MISKSTPGPSEKAHCVKWREPGSGRSAIFNWHYKAGFLQEIIPVHQ